MQDAISVWSSQGSQVDPRGHRDLAPAATSRLVAAFLSGRNPKTLAAYRTDLRCFQRFVGVSTIEAAARLLLSRGHGEANTTALEYRTSLVDRGLAPATINRRLAALRSMVALARTLGLVPWALEVKNVRSEPYRDTRGPGSKGVRRLLDEIGKRRNEPKGVRDHAIVRLLFDLALRRGEVAGLNIEDLDLEAGTVAVLGKGRSQRTKLTLPEPTRLALSRWLEVRGNEPGPLFTNFDRAGKGQRLLGTSIYRIVRDIGRLAGVEVRPHGLRHAAITLALDLSGGDVRAVQRFSRHRDLRVLNRYDDTRADLGGKMARLVASEALTEGQPHG
jgi:integrase/recombinase XerC